MPGVVETAEHGIDGALVDIREDLADGFHHLIPI
jgi:hypothetical protein